MNQFNPLPAAKLSDRVQPPESAPVRIWREGLRRNPPELRYLPFEISREDRARRERGR